MSDGTDDKAQAFARLTEIGRLAAADRPDEAVAAAAQLRALFERRPADPELAGFGTMLLDAALWLLARGRDGDALELCDAVVARLETETESERAVAAGGHFLAAQAAGRLGRSDESRAHLEALCGMGEPALAALDRVTGRLSEAGADPAWHAQVAAASVTVLWRIGRAPEAQAIAQAAADAFTRAGRPELAGRLQALEREIALPGV